MWVCQCGGAGGGCAKDEYHSHSLKPLFPHESPNDPPRRPARVVTSGLRYRLGVAARAIAAIFGGYGVAALSAAVLGLCLPVAFGMARSEATMTALAVMWVFAARTALRAWSGLAIAAASLGALLLVLLRFTGGAAA